MAEYAFTIPRDESDKIHVKVEDPELCDLLDLPAVEAPHQIDSRLVYVTNNQDAYARLLSKGVISFADEKSRVTVGTYSQRIDRDSKALYARPVDLWYDYEHFANNFIEANPVFYDDINRIYYWNRKKLCYERIDETDLYLLIDMSLRKLRNYFKDKDKEAKDNGNEKEAKYFTRLLSDTDTNIPSTRNKIMFAVTKEARSLFKRLRKPEWYEVQFGSELWNLKSGESRLVDESYLVKNPIPWNLLEGETPNIDALFKDWVGEEDQRLLFELSAYAVVPRYFVKKVFWLLGGGDNGKTTYLKFLARFIGRENMTSTDLYQLEQNRFETSSLVDKLVCVVNEVDHKTIWNNRMLKAISGSDMVRIEEKNKQSKKEVLYSKMIIAANHLPRRSDYSDANISRFVGIAFPNKFSPGPDPIAKIRDEEFRAFAYRCVREVLMPSKDYQGMIVTKKLRDEKPLMVKARQYDELSDSLEVFIRDKVEEVDDDEVYIIKSDFYKQYLAWCRENKLHYESKRKTYSRVRNDFDWREGKPRLMEEGNVQKRVFLGVKWVGSLMDKGVRLYDFIKRQGSVTIGFLHDHFGDKVEESLHFLVEAGDVYEYEAGKYKVI